MSRNLINVRGLHEESAAAFTTLINQLAARRSRNLLLDRYMSGQQRVQQLGIAIPPSMETLETVIGWPAKAVNVPERRLQLLGFVSPGTSSFNADIAAVMDRSKAGVTNTHLHTAAFTHGVAFEETVFDPDDGARFLAHGALDATGTLDLVRKELSAALIVNKRGLFGEPTEYVLYNREDTAIWAFTIVRDNGLWALADAVKVRIGRVPVAPMMNEPRPGQLWGTPRITRPIITLTDIQVRTILRMEVNAEFYSAPQRGLLGADEDLFTDDNGEPIPAWEAIIGRMFLVPKNVDGSTATLQTFTQASMQPHTEQMRATAMMFAAESGIPVDYLGVVHDNPSSADARLVAEAELVSICERALTSFGIGHVYSAQNAWMLENGTDTMPTEIERLRDKWADPSTPTKSARTQNVAMLVTAGVLQADSEVTWEMLGYDEVTISRLRAEREQRASSSLVQALIKAPAPAAAPAPGTAAAAKNRPGAPAPVDQAAISQ